MKTLFKKIFLRCSPSYRMIVRIFAIPTLRKARRITGMEYLPSKGPAIFALNHIGPFVDGMMFLGLVYKMTRKRLCYIAQRDRVWNFFGDDIVVAKTGLIPYDETNKRKVLETAELRLLQGDFVGLFPEGIKNTTRVLLKGKTGVARLALATGAPIIPVGILGPKEFYKSFKGCIQFFLQMPPSVEFRIGAPIVVAKKNPQPPSLAEIDSLTRTVMSTIALLTGKTYPF